MAWSRAPHRFKESGGHTAAAADRVLRRGLSRFGAERQEDRKRGARRIARPVLPTWAASTRQSTMSRRSGRRRGHWCEGEAERSRALPSGDRSNRACKSSSTVRRIWDNNKRGRPSWTNGKPSQSQARWTRTQTTGASGLPRLAARDHHRRRRRDDQAPPEVSGGSRQDGRDPTLPPA